MNNIIALIIFLFIYLSQVNNLEDFPYNTSDSVSNVSFLTCILCRKY